MYGGNFMEVMQMPQSDAATIGFVKGTFIMAGIISVILIIVYNFISINYEPYKRKNLSDKIKNYIPHKSHNSFT